MYGQLSNNEQATSHHLTRLNVEFADLIATCNIIRCIVHTNYVNVTDIVISDSRSLILRANYKYIGMFKAKTPEK